MERKCKCGNFFDVREHRGICNECGTNIFETKKETMSKQDTALTKFFDKIRVNYDKDSEEYEQLVTDYIMAKHEETQNIATAFRAGADLGNYYVTDEAENYYNEKYGNA